MNTHQQKAGFFLSAEEKNANSEVWKELNREEGELQRGDSIWDLQGTAYLIGSKNNKKLGIISLATANKMYSKQLVKKICADEEIFTLATAE